MSLRDIMRHNDQTVLLASDAIYHEQVLGHLNYNALPADPGEFIIHFSQ